MFLFLNNIPIPTCKEIKYLGIILNGKSVLELRGDQVSLHFYKYFNAHKSLLNSVSLQLFF